MTVLDFERVDDPERLYAETVRPALRRMGWGDGPDTFAEEVIERADEGIVYRYEIPSGSSFVVGVLGRELGTEGERWVGNIGYNVEAPLALLAAPQRTRLLAPHMIAATKNLGEQSRLEVVAAIPSVHHLRSGADPLVLRVEPTDIETAILRVAVNPDAVAEAASVGGRFSQKGFRARVPVDEALMLHLIRIREQLIREEELNDASLEAYLELDSRLLVLVGTLLFIRTLEDGADPLPARSLWEVARQGRVLEGVHALADQVAGRYGRAAVPLTTHSWRSEGALRELIRGLYFDETQLAPIDFRLLDEDILAQLYQEYLQYLLTDRKKGAQLRILESDDRIPLKVRRDLGIYYTPRSVVDIVRSEIVRHWGDRPDMPRILEPACGAAVFLRPMINWLAAGQWENASAEEIASCLVGIDVDPRAVTLAKQTLGRTFAKLRLTVPELRIEQGDFLDSTADGVPMFGDLAIEEAFDIVVGNPPFLSHSTLKRQSAELAARYRKAFRNAVGGETNLAAYFVLQALRVLRPGGLLGFVVPRRMLRGSNSRIRRTILEEAELLSVVDLGLRSVFRGADETTALLILRKRERRESEPGLCSAPAVFAIHYRDDLAPLLVRALTGQARPSELDGTAFPARCHAPVGGPWLLLTSTGRQAHAALTREGTALGDMLVSSYGVDMMCGGGQTLLFDRVPPDITGPVTTRSSFLQRPVTIDAALLRDAVEAGRIERYRSIDDGSKISVFHPFRADGAAISESELLETNEFSLSAAILRELEPVLRSVTGDRKVPEWYAPAASRVRAPWHTEAFRTKYAATMLVATRFSMVPKVTAAPATLIPVGSVFAFFLKLAHQEHLKRLLVFMNSSLANWYAVMAAPAFSRAGLLDRSSVTLADIRLPDSFLQADLSPVAKELERLRFESGLMTTAEILGAEQALDNWVYDAFGLDEKLRERLRDEVGHFTGNALYRSARDRAATHQSIDELIARHTSPRRRSI